MQGQRYDSAGTAVGGEFQVNGYTSSASGPSVAMDAAGGFVVVWSDAEPSASEPNRSVQGQRYDSGGSAVGSQFQVNSYTTASQDGADVAVGAGGDFVVAWMSKGSFGGHFWLQHPGAAL